LSEIKESPDENKPEKLEKENRAPSPENENDSKDAQIKKLKKRL
jgi:hypothetical protein